MATPSMMPQWSYMHIAGQDASEYLSPGLVQFARATDTYFSLGNKFRNPTVAPTHDVTTDRSQRLTLRFVPVDREDTAYSYKVRFTLAVGDNRVLDMASTYFDIRGVLDRGPSFKPYSGTAYNSLAPKTAPNPCEWKDNNKIKVRGQAPLIGTNIDKDNGIQIGTDATKPIYADKTYQPEPQVGQTQWNSEVGATDKVAGRVLKDTTPMLPCYGSYAKPTNEKGGQANLITNGTDQTLTSDVNLQFFALPSTPNEPKAVLYAENVSIEAPDTHLVYKPDVAQGTISSADLLTQQAAPNRPNYIGFRDNFIGLMYYNSTGNMGVLAGQASQLRYPPR